MESTARGRGSACILSSHLNGVDGMERENLDHTFMEMHKEVR